MVALVALTAVAATIALMGQQATVSRLAASVPTEGFYWSVAQYQIAYHRLRQELRAVAAGEPANTAELSLRADILASRTAVLTEPSDTQDLLNQVPGYTAAVQRLAKLQNEVGPVLERGLRTQTEAIAVLDLLNAADADALISQLATDVRTAEISAKDAMARSASRRSVWIWVGFAACWSALSLWLLFAVRSRRRYRAAARDRQQAVEAMERANLAKQRFLSMVNHEVRSPLQSIVASAELLAMKENRPEGAAAIRRIRYAVTALQGQLRDLLTIARGNAAQLPMQIETFDMGELAQDVCAGPSELANAKGLGFRLDLPIPSLTVSADPVRIAQVLRNLVENAVRYTDSGAVSVSVARVHDSRDCDGNPVVSSAQLVVQDTGPGLPSSAQERLRGPATSLEPRADGSGLGLSVIREVVEQLGGSVEIGVPADAAAESRGTTISVTLPMIEVRNPAEVDAAESTAALRVLLVDDELEVREAISGLIRRLGHDCHAVHEATEAMHVLTREAFDVVLVDFNLPGIDGLKLAEAIRQSGGMNADARLILISADEVHTAGQERPFDGFIHKPVDAHDLARVLPPRR